MKPHPSAPVAGTDALLGDGDCMRIEHGSRTLILIRYQGELYCYANCCPHQGTELDWQPGVFLSPDRQWLQCATHGALFDIPSGRCIAGPCKGAFLERFELAPGSTREA